MLLDQTTYYFDIFTMNQEVFFRAVEDIGDIDFRLTLTAWSLVMDDEISVDNVLLLLKRAYSSSDKWLNCRLQYFPSGLIDRDLDFDDVIPFMTSRKNYSAFEDYEQYISLTNHIFDFSKYMMFYTKFNSDWRKSVFQFECLMIENDFIIHKISEEDYVQLLESFLMMQNCQMKHDQLQTFFDFLCYKSTNVGPSFCLEELLLFSKLDWSEWYSNMFDDVVQILFDKEHLPFLMIQCILSHFHLFRTSNQKNKEIVNDILLCLEIFNECTNYHIIVNKMNILLNKQMRLMKNRRTIEDNKVKGLQVKHICRKSHKNKKMYEIISVNPIMNVLSVCNSAFYQTKKFNLLQTLTTRINNVLFQNINFINVYLVVCQNFHFYCLNDVDEINLINDLLDLILFKDMYGNILFSTTKSIHDIAEAIYILTDGIFVEHTFHEFMIFLKKGELKMSIHQLIFLIRNKIELKAISKINVLIVEKKLLLNYDEIVEFVRRFNLRYESTVNVIEYMCLLKSKVIQINGNDIIHFTKELSMNDFFELEIDDTFFIGSLVSFVRPTFVDIGSHQLIRCYFIDTDELIEANRIQIMNRTKLIEIKTNAQLVKDKNLPNISIDMLKYIIKNGYTVNDINLLLSSICELVSKKSIIRQRVINEHLSIKFLMISLLGNSFSSCHLNLIFDNEKLMYLFHIFNRNQLIEYCITRNKVKCFSKLIKNFAEQELNNFRKTIERKLICSSLPVFLSKVVYEYLDISSLNKMYKLV